MRGSVRSSLNGDDLIEKAHWCLSIYILFLFFTNAHILTHTYANTLALGELLTYWDVRLWALSVWVMHFPAALFSAWDPNWVLMSATALLWVFESTVKVKIPIDDSWPLKRSDLTAGDLLQTSLMHMNPHALTQPKIYSHTSAHRSLQNAMLLSYEYCMFKIYQVSQH